MIAPPNARRVRPNMPHYGVMPDKVDAMLNWDWVERQMAASRSYWICTTCADGRPHCVPVWGIWREGSLLFGSQRQSQKARNIRRDNRVVIHLESGDDSVIFEGLAIEWRGSHADYVEIDRAYLDKYGEDPQTVNESALLYLLQPRKVMAWLESDYPATATYWLFNV